MTVIESQQRIIKVLAESLIEKLINRVIKNLQKLNVCHSGLKNGTTWDDICIQVQSEISIFWDLYKETVDGYIELELEKLSFEEKMLLWFQTEEGHSLVHDTLVNLKEKLGIEDLEDPIYNESAVIQFIFSKIWCKAGEWSNKRIREMIG